jgi:exopolysaccharide production protein ExoZ
MLPKQLELQQKSRLHGLDYLRGLCAFCIMVYHYASWSFGEQPAYSFLGRVGIYGVAIFYILSGQTLSYIYASKLQLNTSHLINFYKKRFLRIYPLLWLATISSIALSKHTPDLKDLLLNLTGLFGLLKWDTYFATGVWSIGNELVFYLTFPLLTFLLTRHRVEFGLITLFIFGIFIYFSFYALQTSLPLSNQWHYYTNPLNQILFFLGGILLGYLVQPNFIKTWHSLLLGLIGLSLFLFIPIEGNATSLVTGLNRFLFAVSCFLLCCSFFGTKRATSLIDVPLALLGQASYSLYLLHPLVYAVVKAALTVAAKHGFSLPFVSPMHVAIPASIIISYASYSYFERFFINLGQMRFKAEASGK